MIQEVNELFVEELVLPTTRKCGCYVVDCDLTQHKRNQHILVPLKSAEYELEIANAITNVTLIQTYHNPTEKFL
jgi:hypothetical protein